MAAPDNIKLNASVNGQTIYFKEFTVCAHPCDFSIKYMSAISGLEVGMIVRLYWKSDAGNRSSTALNKTYVLEEVYFPPSPGTPFNSSMIFDVQYDWASGTSTYVEDCQRMSNIFEFPANLDKTKTYHYTPTQLFLYTCDRCGEQAMVCINSGFQIDHQVYYSTSANCWKYKVVDTPAAVSHNASTQAGSYYDGTSSCERPPITIENWE